MIVRSPLPAVTIPEVPFATLVLRQAQRLADRPALIDGATGRSYTYGQLADAVHKVAASLAQRGMQKGEVFAIYSPNLPEYAIAVLAVATLGGIVTTINPLYTVEELTFQLNDARASYLLTVPPFLDKAQQGMQQSNVKELFVLGEAPGATSFARLLQPGNDVPSVKINLREDLVALPYSSGTTGLPKGVMLTHYNLVANLCQMGAMGLVSEQDTTIAVLPFFHIYGLMVILGLGLYSGATIVSLPKFDLPQFLQTIQDYKVTVGYMVPPIMLALAKHPMVENYDLSSMKVILSAAAPLGKEVQDACIRRLGCIVVQGYGMTETSPGLTLTPPKEGQIKIGSVGYCLPNVECKVVDIVTGAELGPNQEGEICTRGPQNMKGYLNNPTATHNMIDRDGWLHTGDIGYYDEDGYFYIVDRLKELIKYKGLQVAPAELEAVLLSHPAIADAAVIPLRHEEAGEVPKAFVALKPGASATAEEILAYVSERVAPYKKIRQLEFIDEIPKSASGKILRRLLIEREQSK